MNKDELLKIYSAYLPYKTPITLASEEYNYDGLTTILSPHYLLDWQRNKCKISLHLWDLSYLTKEIEHDGERIIPMVYFIKKTSLFDLSKCTFEVYEDDGEVYVNAHGDRVIDSIFYDGNIFWSSKLLDIHEGYRPANPQHTWQEMLLHLHFNVFNLPESEFINKATLTNK